MLEDNVFSRCVFQHNFLLTLTIICWIRDLLPTEVCQRVKRRLLIKEKSSGFLEKTKS